MKKTYPRVVVLLFLILTMLSTISNAQLLNGYNQQFYTSVFNAAEGVAKPFLLQQGYLTMPGVTIHNDTMLMYNGQVYPIISKYQNPESGNPNNYYLTSSQYSAYQIQIFKNVWPDRIPNDFYNYTDFSFSSLADCVGYGTRLLSAIGDTTENGNAYLRLIKTVKTANTTLMAARGFVASAYEIGAAFPTLADPTGDGWGYVCGNINSDSINAFNHRQEPSLSNYNGRIKGGFGSAMAGDVLGFSYSPIEESNGHFMVMTQTPYEIYLDTLQRLYPHVSQSYLQNFLNTYNVYATPVYDCSGRNAHFYDSRRYMSGIGHGTLLVLTSATGDIPQGFVFSTPSDTATSIRSTMIDNISTWAITVGRYEDDGTSIGNNGIVSPDGYALYQNYPNPFNPSTTIDFVLPQSEFTELKVFDMLGKEVARLVSGKISSGYHSVNFNAENLSGGIYFYKLTTGSFTQTKKLILVK